MYPSSLDVAITVGYQKSHNISFKKKYYFILCQRESKPSNSHFLMKPFNVDCFFL